MHHLLRKITVIFQVLADKGTVTHKVHEGIQTGLTVNLFGTFIFLEKRVNDASEHGRYRLVSVKDDVETVDYIPGIHLNGRNLYDVILKDIQARERCGENMHRLYFNYRSPKYLLDVFNTYANMELDVDPHFLPKTNNLAEAGQNSLCIMSASDKDAEVRLVAESVGNFCTSHPDERVANWALQ